MKETNPFILLAVAQHHGMKTRLLDWTFSPLVALFFAVEDESNYDVDGTIFALNTQRNITNIIRSNKSPFEDLGSDYQYLAIPSISPRIIAQMPYFSYLENRQLL